MTTTSTTPELLESTHYPDTTRSHQRGHYGQDTNTAVAERIVGMSENRTRLGLYVHMNRKALPTTKTTVRPHTHWTQPNLEHVLWMPNAECEGRMQNYRPNPTACPTMYPCQLTGTTPYTLPTACRTPTHQTQHHPTLTHLEMRH